MLSNGLIASLQYMLLILKPSIRIKMYDGGHLFNDDETKLGLNITTQFFRSKVLLWYHEYFLHTSCLLHSLCRSTDKRLYVSNTIAIAIVTKPQSIVSYKYFSYVYSIQKERIFEYFFFCYQQVIITCLKPAIALLINVCCGHINIKSNLQRTLTSASNYKKM